eukprot:TRINITY_DN16432_c2_g1_i1.p1 TRINITY_DN16432_c2_g1~~TRINITY_DN16432_c2_g1_i1.p1  ORF type:complete len:126 (+),score=19.02 TRINITY_DN16432_c2_g1_i1:432-809(+)
MEFEIKYLGLLKDFLGIEEAISRSGIVISQRKYILDLLKETEKLGAKPVDTPIEQNRGLHIGSGELLEDKRLYQRLVGKLVYLTITRPDISYTVSLVGQFMHAPRLDHLTAPYRILRYLKGSPGQ